MIFTTKTFIHLLRKTCVCTACLAHKIATWNARDLEPLQCFRSPAVNGICMDCLMHKTTTWNPCDLELIQCSWSALSTVFVRLVQSTKSRLEILVISNLSSVLDHLRQRCLCGLFSAQNRDFVWNPVIENLWSVLEVMPRRAKQNSVTGWAAVIRMGPGGVFCLVYTAWYSA